MIRLTMFIVTKDFPPEDNLAIPGGEFDDSVALAKRLGYDGIELIPGDPDLVDVDSLRAALQRHGMCISAINSGGINYALKISLVNADPAKERTAFAKLQTLIRHSKRLGCLQQVGVSRGYAIPGVPMVRFRDRLVGVLRDACDYAREQGVAMVFEYTNRLEINTINTLTEALEVIELVARPNLGLLLDTGHSWLEDPDVYEAIIRARSHLKHIHLHDSDRGPAGASNGEIDFDRVLGILKEIGYCGAMSDGLLTLSLPEEQTMRSTAFLRATLSKYGLR